jgi:hypothetical protein
LSHTGDPCPRCGETLENCWRCWECRKDLTSEQEDVEHVEKRSSDEVLCDTLHKTDWDSETMRALLRGLDTEDEARRFARAEAMRGERHGVEPRRHVVAAANERAQEVSA